MGEKLWHFDTLSFWADGPLDSECTQLWEISPFGGPSAEQRYAGEGIFRRPMTLTVFENRPRDLPESYEPSAKPWQMVGGELVPRWTTPLQRLPPGWNGEWAQGMDEAVARMRVHLDRRDPKVPHIKFDARDRLALRFILAAVSRPTPEERRG